jgi:GrpB-like predicted nucleotidyltransferase (UPF0157 family)
MRTIVVVDYDPRWPDTFEQLRAAIWPVVSDVALAIEHVGSTSVPGLAAKPIVDLSVVIPTEAEIPQSIDCLATLGYVHRGNLGVEGREAFDGDGRLPKHHLYVCPRRSIALANHLAVRDHLRRNPETAHRYGELKKLLARMFPHDIDRYVHGKTDLILEILCAEGFPADRRAAIARANAGALFRTP